MCSAGEITGDTGSGAKTSGLHRAGRGVGRGQSDILSSCNRLRPSRAPRALSNKELAICPAIVRFEIIREFQSLNLSIYEYGDPVPVDCNRRKRVRYIYMHHRIMSTVYRFYFMGFINMKMDLV